MGKYYNFLNVGVWNIHGLFSNVNKVKINKINDPEFKSRLKQFEILCLQEILCGPDETSSLSIEGYKMFPIHREISGNHRFYGGSMLLIKNNIKPGVKIVDKMGGDKIWIKLSKEYFNLESDQFICFAYVSPLTSSYTRKMDHDPFSDLEADISKFSSEGYVMLAGDFNGKTNVNKDFVVDLDDDHSPINSISTYKFDIPLQRRNQDKHPMDEQGVRFLELCKETQLRILNGRT